MLNMHSHAGEVSTERAKETSKLQQEDQQALDVDLLARSLALRPLYLSGTHFGAELT